MRNVFKEIKQMLGDDADSNEAYYGKKKNWKNDKRAVWNQKFEKAVLKLDKKYAGRIEWDSAIHLNNTGLSPQEAAKQYVERK